MTLRVALLALLLVGAGSVARAEDEAASHIAPAELLRLIDAGQAPVVLDVRSQREYESGHVPGALHLPFWAVLGRRSDIPAAPEDTLVVYCAHGPRAGAAKASLRMLGFEKVVYLEGHMSGWKEAGLPQETAEPAADAPSPGSRPADGSEAGSP